MTDLSISDSDIAIIGMSCRFPGAKDIDTLWENLKNGVESVSFFSDQELKSAGIDAATLDNPNYVKANAVLSDIDLFDAAFFEFNPREAETTDPQHRIFLECAWEALESSGYAGKTDQNPIGVYAGVGMSYYLFSNLYPSLDSSNLGGLFSLGISNDKDYLPTRLSYKLNLKGPSVNVQTACSTSLVAVHLACQSLLNGECDIALAGGVSIMNLSKSGYLYQEGMILSPDGHCRAFDAKAKGTVSGDGVGIVVLKRLEEAIEDGDYIHAIIKGSAVNNDGSLKIGYTAPSVDGQAGVISEAQAIADIEADTISYIEAHGTGTELGDPIEIAALNKVFRATTDKKNFCAIGSVKTNFGHTNAAAGVAGLIKTALALKHKQLPPSLHFEQANPKIDFANSPFYVNSSLSEWQVQNKPRRAGVSSFGIGGTNAHVVLEEAPSQTNSGESRSWQLLIISAKTPSALTRASSNLATYLELHSDINIADVAYTLSEARRAFKHRYMLVCQNLEEATTALRNFDATGNIQTEENQAVVFMFSGQGSQYVNMALELYQNEPVFREEVDLCSEYLKNHLNLDLRQLLYPKELKSEQLNQTGITQPALFVIEYALAKLWMSWGVYPEAMIGHSIGEYVAACLSGVFSLEDALSLVAARGQMMQSMPSGTMLAVSLPEEKVQSFLGKGISLAAINTPDLCVVSGNTEAVDSLEKQLIEQNIECRRLHTSHAFHSEMMEPVLSSFIERAKQVTFATPQIPYISNVTGTWITAKQAMDPNYWAKHLRQTVRFADGMQELLKNSRRILLEVGPGRTLMTLARRHPDKTAEQVVLNSLSHPQDKQSDLAFLLNTVGKLWLAGGEVDWSGFYNNEQRRCLPLPTYPFERQRYWVDPPKYKQDISKPQKVPDQISLERKPDIADWFYVPYWKPSALPPPANAENLETSWLLFCDNCGVSSQLIDKITQNNKQIVSVKIGSTFSKLSEHEYTLNPQQAEDYNSLIKELLTSKKIPQRIVHLWSVTPNISKELSFEKLETAQDLGFYSLLFLAQALGKQNITDEIEISVVSNNVQAVTGGEDLLYPEKATILGPVKVIGQEYPNINCYHIDISIPYSMNKDKASLFLFKKLFSSSSSENIGIDSIVIDQLFSELTSKNYEQLIAYRGKQRWVQSFEPVRLEKPVDEMQSLLKEKGVYLITGGLGGIGFTLAEHLAKTVQAKLILIGRSTFPAKEEWSNWLSSHDNDNVISQKIKKVQGLEAQGAEVLIASADVANLEQMQKVVITTEKQFGQINGVIHAAGIIGEKSFSTIEQAGKTDSDVQFQPKIHGTLVLKKVLLNKKLDFCLLFSSLSSVLGGLGFVAYSAANIFMNAFVYQQSQTNPVPWISLNWDGWRLGHTKPSTSFGATLAELAIMPDEGINAFMRVLSNSLVNNQLVISTGELHTRIEQTIKSKSTLKIDKKKSSTHPRPSLSTPYVAPRNDLEQKLVEIWQKFLGIEKIGIYDDFFELGGDSLLAVQLIAKLRDTFQINLPAHSLLNAQTIAGFAKFIEDITSKLPNQETLPSLPSSLVELQAGNRLKTPLFLIHPLGGHVYSYRDLISNLDSEQPVYGIQAQGLDGKTDIITKIEEMASNYIEAMRVLQPKGPYFLGGICFGGLVAFEIAQQLHKQGQKIALLAMIDTLKAGQKPILRRTTRDKVGNNTCKTSIQSFIGQLALALLPPKLRKLFIGKFLTNAEIIAYFLELGANVPVSLKELRKLKPDDQLRYFLKKQNNKEKQILDDSLYDINQIRHFFHIFKANVETFWDYEPQVYPGRIIFFHATERDAYTAPELGWQDLAAGGLEVIKVQGNHLSMNDSPNVEVIAKRLKTELEKAQAAGN